MSAAALFVLVLALVGAACGGSSSNSDTNSDDNGGKIPDGSVAVVDGQGITKVQLTKLLATAQANYKKNNQKFPKVGTNDYERLKQRPYSSWCSRPTSRSAPSSWA